MSGIVKNSLRLVGATKNVTSETTTWQRSMWHMAKRSDYRKNNLIALSKTQNFSNCQYRLHHILADCSKEATKIKIPKYKPKDDDKEVDEKYDYVSLEKRQLKKLFASVDNNGEIILKTIEGHEIFTVDGNDVNLSITEEVFQKLRKEFNAEKMTPKAIREQLMRSCNKFISGVIVHALIKNLSCFSEHVYEENGLRPVLDIFSHVI